MHLYNTQVRVVNSHESLQKAVDFGNGYVNNIILNKQKAIELKHNRNSFRFKSGLILCLQ